MKRRNHLKYSYNILFPASLQVAFRDAATSIASSGASVFVDELAGYSTASLDSVRHVTATSDFALGAFTETGAGIAKPPSYEVMQIQGFSGKYAGEMAERKGFEPSRPFPICTLSRGVPSTTRPPLRRGSDTGEQ